MSNNSVDELFERRMSYPDFDYRERLAKLVGLDDQKSRLSKILGLLINPNSLSQWIEKYHRGAENISLSVLRRPPLVILSGDVGSGKTELAETIGDMVARQEDIDLTLYPLSLSSRGQGRVGEMTRLISSAFEHVVNEAEKLKSESGTCSGGIILLIDEADALAQSRESSQMHHEDRAGVNAFIRGIDRIANGKLPAAVIMCTNRENALDPAIRRRAADILSFSRPSAEQRKIALEASLSQLGLKDDEISTLVSITGSKEGRDYGFTFSDLTQRLIPSIVLDAFPNKAVTLESAIRVAKGMSPTPPFKDLEHA